MLRPTRLAAVAGFCALCAQADATITAFSGGVFDTPADLDTFMGTPLLPVPYDGTPYATGYGDPPSLTPGIALATPLGPMGFQPEHIRTASGTPTSSGAFRPIPLPDPIADSHVIPPSGATAIDFFINAAPGSPANSFQITATGTSTTATFTISGVNQFFLYYLGFGAVGETITDIHIVNLPDPTPVSATWDVSSIRVLPTPGVTTLLLGAACAAFKRRRR